jgi:hypothetical protein
MLGAGEYLVLIPNNIVRLGKGEAGFPYFWTLVTSTFIEENLFFLGVYLTLANYIVVQNRQSLE